MLIDIKRKRRSFYRTLPQINLSYERVIRIPIKAITSGFLMLFFVVSYIFNLVMAPTNGDVYAAVDKQQERQALEAQLAELNKEIDVLDQQRIAEFKKGNTLTSEIKGMDNKIAKLKLQIKAITITLQRVSKEITVTTTQIGTTETKIGLKKQMIANILQSIQQSEKRGILMTLLENSDLSKFFTNLNDLASVGDQLRVNVNELQDLHTQLSDQKETLSLEKNDIEQLKEFQVAQQQGIQQMKQEKDNLLKVTKGKESEYKKILAEKQKTAAQIRSRIFDLIGGGQLSFGDAYKFAKAAESATGVRAAFILAILDGESKLGKNVGQCKYDVNPYYPNKASNKTTMHPTRDIPEFLKITQKLGLNPDTIKVSCPIPSDGAFGGAMGPAQFIPSTWVTMEAQVASLTGHNPPNPWNSQDAFMATALYLRDLGAGTGASLYQEKRAAARYYAGIRWSYHMNDYGAAAIDRAGRFEQDIATLTA